MNLLATDISRREILRKTRIQSVYRCSLPSHCRGDPRITKDCIEVLQILSFRVFFDFGRTKRSPPHKLIFFEDLLRLPPGLHAQNNSTIQCKHPQQFRKSQREIFVVLGNFCVLRCPHGVLFLPPLPLRSPVQPRGQDTK